MASISGLYMEDYEEQYKQYGQVLEIVWKINPRLSSLGEFNLAALHYVDSPEKALDSLKKNGNDYTVFIADLLYHENRVKKAGDLDKDGLNAVFFAAQNYPKIVIIGLSVGEEERRFTGIKQEFHESGGDLYFSKSMIRKASGRKERFQQMGKEIEQVLSRKHWFSGLEISVGLRFDQNDWILNAELEAIGDSVFKSLLQQLAPDCVNFELGHADPGLSGASVFKVIGENEKGTKRHLFVKVSRDAVSLQRELEGVPKAGTFRRSGVCPETLREKPVEDSGWFAIAYALLGNTSTLQSWLLEHKPSHEQISAFLGQLFGELINLYRARTLQATESAVDALFPQKVFGIRSLVCLDELWPLVERHSSGQKLDSRMVRDFIVQKRIGNRIPDSIPPGTIVCDSHGDLHSRNILVSLDSRQPHLVDFSERGEKHWSSDFAQLCSDLFIRVWDHGVEGHEWSRLAQWRLVLQQWLLFTGTGSEVNEENRAIWDCLVWVRQNYETLWRTIRGDTVSSWQFQLALVVEFIRLVAQPDVYSPKRAFALVAVHDILGELEKTIPLPSQ